MLAIRLDPVRTPIHQTTTFEQERATGFGAFDYSRSSNPTRCVLEEKLADLESGYRAFAFASGMAAVTATTRLVPSGGKILAGADLYGGSFRLLQNLVEQRNLNLDFVDGITFS